MEYRAEFELNRSYFEENFDQWLRYRSKYRRWQVQLSIAAIALGLFLIAWVQAWRSVIVVMIGIVELVEFYFYKHRWIRQRIDSRAGNDHNGVVVKISETGMYQAGPTSEGSITWEAVKAVVPTEKGILLSVGDGMSVYISNSSMNDSGFRDYAVKMVAGDT